MILRLHSFIMQRHLTFNFANRLYLAERVEATTNHDAQKEPNCITNILLLSERSGHDVMAIPKPYGDN